ncbi:hypothetical protein ACMT1E_05015 [Sphingomonas flavalba]|uniref:hypothetical protein n=1 Tax=Sphingomonas flavalba TaxID=2559804 RepID=UPI0039E1C312
MNEAVEQERRSPPPRLSPERVAYWYFRLNGFLQIENFVVHPKLNGGQRTDADLIGVRFPFRAERLIDDPDDLMQDDADRLQLLNDRADIVIAEIKTGLCALNGPWTNEEHQNIHRVLAAIGSLPAYLIDEASNALYADASFDRPDYPRIRLILVGREPDPAIAEKYAGITQLTWAEILSFIWQRFQRYWKQKKQVEQWDQVGRHLKDLVRRTSEEDFIASTIGLMGVLANKPEPTD